MIEVLYSVILNRLFIEALENAAPGLKVKHLLAISIVRKYADYIIRKYADYKNFTIYLK